MKKIRLAIVGATGVVGRTALKVLEEKKLPIDEYVLFASSHSAGKKIRFMDRDYIVQELNDLSFDSGFDYAIFSAGSSTSKKYAPIAASNGCIVIDNSSAFRMDPQVPLVVPEVNPEEIQNNHGIIANPNCSTIQAVVALKPLDDKYKIKRIVYSTYQAVSGAGRNGILDLENGIKNYVTDKAYFDSQYYDANCIESFDGSQYKKKYDSSQYSDCKSIRNTSFVVDFSEIGKVSYPLAKFNYPIFSNCIPHIDDFLENGYTKEEEKMINETRKILKRQDLKITATTVRVPVFNSHSESINVEFEKTYEMEDLINTLANSSGIILQDNLLSSYRKNSNAIAENKIDKFNDSVVPENESDKFNDSNVVRENKADKFNSCTPKEPTYPLAVYASGHDEVFVGRIRRDDSVASGVNLWVVADNIRKGAASNAVQILEKCLEQKGRS